MLRMLVTDLLAKPGHSRTETAVHPVEVRVLSASVADDATVTVTLTALTDGIIARGTASVPVELACNRCLVEWVETLDVPFEQVFRHIPQDADEELPIDQGAAVDLEPVVHDEISLALPLTPVCHAECQGLCSVCGTDLNTSPCEGHDEVETSPFAALKQLFET